MILVLSLTSLTYAKISISLLWHIMQIRSTTELQSSLQVILIIFFRTLHFLSFLGRNLLNLSILSFFLWITILIFIFWCLFPVFLFFTEIRKKFPLETGSGEELECCKWKSCGWNYSLSRLQGRFVRKRFSSNPNDQPSWVAARRLHVLLQERDEFSMKFLWSLMLMNETSQKISPRWVKKSSQLI